MMKHEVWNEGRALLYITDCNLATVSSMAMKKSRAKGEFQRQIDIAQTAVDWIVEMGLDNGEVSTRADEIIKEHSGKVQVWAKKYMPEHKFKAVK